MDYETRKELRELITSAADDFLETKALLSALIDINECDVTSCIVMEIARDLVGNVFHKSNKCKSLLELE